MQDLNMQVTIFLYFLVLILMHFITGESSSSFLYNKEHCPGYSNIEPFLQGSVLKSHFLKLEILRRIH